VASDDSEGEETPSKKDEEVKQKVKGGQKVTLKMVSMWSQKLNDDASLGSLKRLIGAFRCAVQQSGAKEDAKVKQTAFVIEGSSVFNAVIRACLLDIRPAFTRILQLPSDKTMEKKDMLPSESSFWMRIQKDVKLYLISLIQLLQEMAESSIVAMVLKHIHQMVPYIICFPKVARACIRRLVKLWSQEEETVRVLAFLSVLKIAHRLQDKVVQGSGEWCLGDQRDQQDRFIVISV
jgi:nucleolar complex protein 2